MESNDGFVVLQFAGIKPRILKQRTNNDLFEFFRNSASRQLVDGGGALKSRDLTTRHHIARVDIARLVLVFE